jgi:hypothetical protein
LPLSISYGLPYPLPHPGVKLLARPTEQATHYLTDRITLSPPLFAGLLTPAHIVTEEWLNEHLRLAQLPAGLPDGNADGVNPEQTYVPVPEERYLPPFDDSLPLDMHSALQWTPRATRMKLFAKLRFVILTETTRPVGGLVDLITVGGGEYEGFNVQQGTEAFEALLVKLNAKGKSTAGVVPVADTEGMEAALGSAGWKDFIATANRYVSLSQTLFTMLINTSALVKTSSSSAHSKLCRPLTLRTRKGSIVLSSGAQTCLLLFQNTYPRQCQENRKSLSRLPEDHSDVRCPACRPPPLLPPRWTSYRNR